MLTTEKHNDNRFNVRIIFTTLIYYRQYFVIKIDIVIFISFSYIGRLHAGEAPTTRAHTRNYGEIGGTSNERSNRRQRLV